MISPFTNTYTMKILYIIDSFQVGGAEKSLLDISSHLVGAEVVVCGVYKRDDLLHEFKSNGIPSYHLKIEGKYSWLKAFKEVCKIVEKEKPDIIHATLFRSCILSRIIGQKYSLPIINSIVSDSYGVERTSSMQTLRRVKHYYTYLLDRLTARKVNLFISNSEAIKKSYSFHLSVPESRIETIYRGRKASQYIIENKKNRREVLKTYSLDKYFIFICVGRLVESKGHFDLLKAFKQLSQKYNHTSLLIVGEGPFRKNIEKYIAINDLDKKAILLGNRDDVPSLLSISDAFVTSTYYEGLSGAIIEAMFSSIPIIASDIEPNLELIGTDKGWAFKKGEPADLLCKMELLLQNARTHDFYISNALNFAKTHLEISSVAKKYIDTYSKIINENTLSRH